MEQWGVFSKLHGSSRLPSVLINQMRTLDWRTEFLPILKSRSQIFHRNESQEQRKITLLWRRF